MYLQSYDTQKAEQLVPFLISISNEIRERRVAIKGIERELPSHAPESEMSINLQADRANHRKELRLALKEVTRLGCSVAREFPLRVIIPGPSGELDGFLWDSGDTHLQPLTADSAA